MKIFSRQGLGLEAFLVVARSVDCGCGLEPEAALTRNRDPRSERQWGGGGFGFQALSTENAGSENANPRSAFGAKIRRIGVPMQTPVLLYKGGV